MSQHAIGSRAPEQKAAATHVSPTDELQGKLQEFAENWQQVIGVLAGGNASEQNERTVPGSSSGEG